MKQYNSYKDSGIEWIGKIPSHWDYLRIRLFFYLKGRIGWQGLKADEFLEEGPYLVTGTDFENGKVVWERCYHISEERYNEAPEIHVKRGDVLITKDGTVGKMAYIDDMPEKVSLNSHLLIMRPLSDKLYNKFTYWAFQTDSFLHYKGLAQSGSIMESLSQEKVANFIMPFPPFAEQQVIASYLDSQTARIDNIIQARETKIKLLEELRTAVISKAVTKGIRKNVKTKDSGIDWVGQIPKHWVVRRLKFFSDFFSKGNGIKKEEIFEDGDTPCVRYGDIYTKYDRPFTECVCKTRKEIHPVKRYFEYGDILFAGTGELIEEIGKNTVYLGGTACLAGGDIIILHHHQDPIFLNYVLNSKYVQSQKSCGKAKLKVVHISSAEIANIIVALPPIEEQKEIANYIQNKVEIIEKNITKTRSEIELIKEYRDSLISEVVTGKIMVV